MTTTLRWYQCLATVEGTTFDVQVKTARHTLTTGTRRAPHLVAKIMPDYPITPATAGRNDSQGGSGSLPAVAGLTERACTAEGCVVGVVHVVPTITLADGTEIHVPDDTFTSDCECCRGLGFHATTEDAS